MKFSDSAYPSYEVYAQTQPRPSANVPASQLPAETVTSEPIIAELTSYLASIPNRPLVIKHVRLFFAESVRNPNMHYDGFYGL